MKKKTKKALFDGYYKLITGKAIVENQRTKPLFEKSGQLEKVVLMECLKWLIARGALARRNNVGMGSVAGDGRIYQYGIKHAGDIICCLPGGKYCEIECKHGDGGTWSKEQQEHAEKVKRCGGLYYVVHSVDELKHFIMPLLPKGELNL